MRCSILNLACCALFLAVTVRHTTSLPVTLDKAEIIEIVPVNDQESLGEEAQLQLSERNKRTIGMLRQLFPGLSEMIDKKVEELVQYLVRIIGRAVLQGGLFGGGGDSDDDAGDARSNSGSSRRVSVTLPTFPPDLEGDDDDDDDDNANASVDTATNSTSTPAALQTTADNSENSLSGAESQQNEVRVAYDGNNDQETAASGGNDAALSPADDLSDVDADDDDENRNKRYLSFGFGGDAGASAGGSGGGSGNFLFDIIRNTADRAARAAGTVYRVVAGTESLGFGLTATSSETKTLQPATNPPANPPQGFFQQLVAGSGSSESSDEAANAAADGSVKADGTYQEGIPGPITRLFVIANRGLSNLVQDLILRLAQTSERLVNFKARLITSLI